MYFFSNHSFSSLTKFHHLETKCTGYLWEIQSALYGATTFLITFRRLQTFYVRMLIWPNAALLTLSSLVFILPSSTCDRPSFGITVLLALTVNMMIITDFIPEASRGFPKVCNYFFGSILFCALGILMVSIIDRAEYNSQIAEDQSKCERVYCVGVGEKPNGCPAGGREISVAEKVAKFWLRMQRILKKNEPKIGFVYFLCTLVVHFVSYFVNTWSKSHGKPSFWKNFCKFSNQCYFWIRENILQTLHVGYTLLLEERLFQ